jgi:hypothetical protein
MQTAVVEPPAAQVLLELLDHEARQPTVLLHALDKRRPVLRHHLVEHRALGTVADAWALGSGANVCGMPTPPPPS